MININGKYIPSLSLYDILLVLRWENVYLYRLLFI